MASKSPMINEDKLKEFLKKQGWTMGYLKSLIRLLDQEERVNNLRKSLSKD